ncbi:hypothetical protein CK556_03550 [Mesoplasma chauliocola]|uniref:Uncharacterized protein n=1 Tax=Mesoplasma chauliocola TaxID=216427 RepID=A0A249SPK1_9MOLU|nr:hypothetical protein [Mesoplasma chauliocola]ASZ09401.1 hypothetical protein CK556_03550 [Mesoplasma chauliocola]
MNKIKEKYSINDLSDYLILDESVTKIKLAKEIEIEDNNFNLNYFVNEEGEFTMDSIDKLCQEKFPFIQNPSSKILNEIFARNKIAKKLIINSLDKRNSSTIKFDGNDEEHKIAKKLAKSVVYDLNKFIYKHKINYIITNVVLANLESNEVNYFGQIDLIVKSEKEWFLCIFKFSKSPFELKYKYEAMLQKKLIENNSLIKISKAFVFNPLNDIVINEISIKT